MQAPELTGLNPGFTIATAPPLEQVAPSAAAAGMAAPALSGVSSSFGRQPWVAAAQPGFTATGGVAAAAPAERLGYLRLTSFSQNAAEDTRRAIQDLEVR